MTVIIQQVNDPAELAECHRIRRMVFIDEQRVPAAEEWDALDGSATHFLLFVDSEAVGTARVRVLGPAAKLERIALLFEARGQGYGAALMKALVSFAKNQPNVIYAVLSGQVQAVPFYEKQGFEICSEAYLEAGIMHHEMQKSLANQCC